MTVSEQQLATWAKPPSDSEKQRCVNAVALIKDAIRNDPVLSRKNIQIFGQGSHQNHTNVRLDSDVDVCVVFKGEFYFKLPTGRTHDEFGITLANSYTFAEYKNSVLSALRDRFGRNDVDRGNKSIKVRSSSNRVEADVVPAFEHRQYTGRQTSSDHEYHEGIKFIADDGNSVVNFPKQHEKNGNEKNIRTSHRYKRIVRLLKKINYELDPDGYIPSFLVECLAWNVSDFVYLQNSNFIYAATLRDVLDFIYLHTNDDPDLSEDWEEVNGLIPLFRGHSKWTKGDVANFIVKARNYVGLS